MRSLQINQSDTFGGAAIASYRLHQVLLQKKIDSKLLVGTVRERDPNIARVPRYLLAEKVIRQFTRRIGLNYLEYFRSLRIDRHPFVENADVVNLHNLHTGYFNYLAIPRLSKKKPLVLTMHDMWTITGHCAYSLDCGKWESGCGACPYPNVYPEIRMDLTKLEWRLKSWAFGKPRITVITPSLWLKQIAEKSLLKNQEILHIPNGLNLKIYKPLPKAVSRKRLGIGARDFVIMFAAHDLSDPRKGLSDIVSAAITLSEESVVRRKITLLLLGQNSNIPKNLFPDSINVVMPGYLNDDQDKVHCFSAADVFFFPTQADNLPIVLQESMACGTPMISYPVGGVPELVRDGKTGMIIQKGDRRSLVHSFRTLLQDLEFAKRLSNNCRRLAESEYSDELQAERYIKVYKNAIEKFRKS
ncbi:hypothetical protein CH373_12380 [Leptospira perolatii]|uniref:Glycosyl transferase n=1 Tax=Leptospira perolatii TaxID=2023191 RepID=A0A2M9ZL83_9LEPT|nr:glycosyltransferase family 4 protein [Leptospira perolatii]PJZ70266.1 hypothetical protein CH360_06590 [Leptospira perolatii]PJZ72850.1 hypothetical protein CH373_12380 [Leptospira perolatii]